MNDFNGWSYYGTAVVITALPQGLSAARRLINVRVPKDCNIESIEAAMDSMAGGALTAIIAIFRDAAGDIALVGDGPTGATQTITTGTATATDGTAVWTVDKDHHQNADSIVDETQLAAENYAVQGGATQLPSVQYADLWVAIRLNVGTANLNRLTVNWRS